MPRNPENELTYFIENVVKHSEKNRLQRLDQSPIYDPPLVGFARGDDHLFDDYKRIIGEFHWTPREMLKMHFPEWNDKEDSCSVVCWVLPITEETRRSNASQSTYPSERWAHTRLYGEQFNDHLRQTIVDQLASQGYLAVAPILSQHYGRGYTGNTGLASSWSERHVLYVAGMGTFSLSDGFITPKGIAVRCGSIVTNLELEPTTRAYKTHLENCLFYRTGKCAECISRCPVRAITEMGHDKAKCGDFLGKEAADYVSKNYGVKGGCCGLCQTRVPCESKIP